MAEGRSDAELLVAVRGGDQRAYEALWHRHFDAALRYAHHQSPSRAEDLVSESFLAVYAQLTTTPKGPTFAFRSYLKAVIRNNAIKWGKEANQVITQDELELVDHRDGLSAAERDADAEIVLSAFQALPDRWQRVLWLSEVAEAGRSEIARELGIKPNAVSALQIRARAGMKLQWLTRQIPEALRADPTHVARLLPQHLTTPGNAAIAAEVAAHVAVCLTCDRLLADLRHAGGRMRGGALSAALIGALGAGVPAGLSVSSGTAAAATGTGLLSWLIAGGLSAATAGGLVLSLLVLAPVVELPPSSAAALTTPAPDARDDAHHPGGEPTPSATTPPPTAGPDNGRGVKDGGIDDIDFTDESSGNTPPFPVPPKPADPTTPGPGTSDDTLSPGVTTPAVTTGYFSPVVAGRATPGSSVAIEIDAERYTPPVAADGGWNFDIRPLGLPEGTYEYRVWAFDAATQSIATVGSFTVRSITVKGFEDVNPSESMDYIEASTTGIVIEITGPPNGRIYVSTLGNEAFISLDANGYAKKRLRLTSRGWYYLLFSALEDDYLGPGYTTYVSVFDPDHPATPRGDLTFEIDDL